MAAKTERQKAYYKELKVNRPFLLRSWAVKGKCNDFNIPFNLSPEYLEEIWTGFCGISKLPINLYGQRQDPFHAELDRIVPGNGYVRGNVQWVSRKFNMLKSNSTFEEIKILYDYFDQLKKEYT